MRAIEKRLRGRGGRANNKSQRAREAEGRADREEEAGARHMRRESATR
jgi:hypothetical protein